MSGGSLAGHNVVRVEGGPRLSTGGPTALRFFTKGDAERRPARRGRFAVSLSRAVSGGGFYEGPSKTVGRQRLYLRSLVAADVIAAVVALLVVIDDGGRHVRLAYFAALPLIVLSAKLSGLYDQDDLLVGHSTLSEIPRLVKLAAIWTLLGWIGDRYALRDGASHINVLSLWLVFAAGLAVARSVARTLASHAAAPERCLFVGPREVGDRVATVVLLHYPKLALVGFFSATEFSSGMDELEQAVVSEYVQRLIVDAGAIESSAVLDLVRLAKALGVQVSLLPNVSLVVESATVFDAVDGMVVLDVPRIGLTYFAWATKRVVDFAVALLGIICLAPLLVLIAAVIRLDSSGPILRRETRVGRDGNCFALLTFRSDRVDADAQAEHSPPPATYRLFDIPPDPSVTRVGRWLRRTGLDELPQLLNVLRGDMSLVGPTPLIFAEDALAVGWRRRRLRLTPGMTGPWQMREARMSLDEATVDYLYVTHWSPWNDFRIVVRGLAQRRSG
jgi:lipopolysaccharide/colanic/teichoic acid biosynthesis glycosyltransferase